LAGLLSDVNHNPKYLHEGTGRELTPEEVAKRRRAEQQKQEKAEEHNKPAYFGKK
jgi:hypothetical protein